jgi:Family of unknown function (DUF6885)
MSSPPTAGGTETTIDLSTAELLPGAARLAELHAAELPQKDELCGSFCTLLALRAAGLDIPDQDAVALAAGAVLPPPGYDHLAALPEGEQGRQDYRLELPVIADGDLAGTSAPGLVRAVSALSGGTQTALPIAGPWQAGALDELLQIAAAEEQASVILNLATGALWGSRPPLAALLGYLATGDDSLGPAADWQVGHFTGCLGAIRGAAGTLVLVADTYASLGWNGVHLQPIERVAASLRRDALPTAGGALLVVPADRAESVGAALGAAGLTVAAWDNGSPDAGAG